MRILITGVAGFLGHRFACWVSSHHPDCEIAGIDDLSGGFRENVPASVDFHQIRLGNGGHRLKSLFLRQYDVVYHFAAYAAEGLSPFVRQYNYTNNLLGTAEVLNAVLGSGNVGRLVFASSMSVYGRGDVPFTEEAALCPIDPYGIAKAACEQDIQVAGEQHGLKWCIVRPHNVYGPGQNLWDPYRNVLAIWMRRLLDGKSLRVYGDGTQRRAFSWIDDCLPCLWGTGVNPGAAGEIINLGGRAPIRIRDTADLVLNVTGRPGLVEHVEPRHEVRDAWATTDKSERLLGYRETQSLHDGLTKMWRWAVRQKSRRPRSPMIELTNGLYPYWAQDLSLLGANHGGDTADPERARRA